jgi:hypothetical protein
VHKIVLYLKEGRQFDLTLSTNSLTKTRLKEIRYRLHKTGIAFRVNVAEDAFIKQERPPAARHQEQTQGLEEELLEIS